MINRFSKRGYEFSFTWIFTIFIGASVIFLAIYIATQLVETQQGVQDTTEGVSLGVLLTPLETQTQEGKFARIFLPDETRIYYECEPPEPGDIFGSTHLKISEKPPLGSDWEESLGEQITFHNKYIFPTAEENPERVGTYVSEGKENFYTLSVPFYLPFKVADLLIIWSDEETYCFKDLSSQSPAFKRKLERLIDGAENIYLNPGREDPSCEDEHTIVCFNTRTSGCDVRVHTAQEKVTKNGRTLHYIQSLEHNEYSLLYAAIFSEPEIYNCQLRRVMAHASKLSDIYLGKAQHIKDNSPPPGCGSNAIPFLLDFKQKTDSVAEAEATNEIQNTLQNLKTLIGSPGFNKIRGGGSCELF